MVIFLTISGNDRVGDAFSIQRCRKRFFLYLLFSASKIPWSIGCNWYSIRRQKHCSNFSTCRLFSRRVGRCIIKQQQYLKLNCILFTKRFHMWYKLIVKPCCKQLSVHPSLTLWTIVYREKLMCLKQRGLALLCTNVRGSLQVPAPVAHPNGVTLSLGFLKFFAWVSPECTRLLNGRSLHHNLVSSALKI